MNIINLTIVVASLIMMLLFLVFFYALWTSSQALLPDEVNRTSKYSEQCGGHFGFFYASRPFVRASIYDEFLVIKSLFWSIKINRNDLVSVDKEEGILADPVRVTFLRGQGSEEILLYCDSASSIHILLRDMIRPTNSGKLGS